MNVHLHVLVLDGVFHDEEDGSVEFAWLRSPSESETGGLLATIRHDVVNTVERVKYSIGRSRGPELCASRTAPS